MRSKGRPEQSFRPALVRGIRKFAIRRRNDGARGAAHIRDAPDGSRKRLGVDHIDLCDVHRVDKSIPIEVTVGELARLVNAQRNAKGPFSDETPNRARMPSSRRRVGVPSTRVAR